jgi:hypothetical protein
MTRDELRDAIKAIILDCTEADTNDANFAADRILSIPKIAEGIGMVVVKDISERT